MSPGLPCLPTTRPISARPSSIWAPAPPRWRCSSAAGSFISEGFALGGQHVTTDIARGLNARVADAERIKTLYGSVLTGGSDERDMITVPPISDDEREQAQFVPRATLVHIIKPRVEEILEMVRDRLAASPFAAEPRGHVILTGGASQLTGLAGPRRAHSRPAGPHRPAARHFRTAGCRQGRGIRGRRPDSWFIRRRRISNISKHAAQAAPR